MQSTNETRLRQKRYRRIAEELTEIFDCGDVGEVVAWLPSDLLRELSKHSRAAIAMRTAICKEEFGTTLEQFEAGERMDARQSFTP